MTEEDFKEILSKPLDSYNEIDLANIMLYKADNTKIRIPTMIFRLIAARLKSYHDMKVINK